ncbi:MAG: c-type cytochrome [Zoogloeaceae bacterium]|jgi:cytochrome c|nr:c-type cytochrome [Zoogloeaceae bacterium]
MKAIYIAMMAVAGVVMAGQAQAADESALAKSKNCLTCHTVDKKLIGPAYKDIAAKYKASDAAMLVDKIKKGGSGVWGAVPMTANNVTDDEAKRLVTWILSQK